MNLDSTFNFVNPIPWWRNELEKNPKNLIGPASVMGATTLIVTVVSGKYFALGFVCFAFITYPLCHYQIEYLTFLDTNETVIAVAVVGIQLFCIKFPLMSQWGLPMSVALAYSITVRGMRIRQILNRQKIQLKELETHTSILKEQIEELTRNSTDLKAALTTLKNTINKKRDVNKIQNATMQERNDVVLEIDNDYSEITRMINELTMLCNTALQESGVLEQLSQINTNAQEIARQTKQIELKNQELLEVIHTLNKAYKKFQDLIIRAEKNEEQVQAGLQQFHTWLISINPSGMHLAN